MSIIIPAYNTAPYIHRAIESSLRQTHKNVEVIVINDGSADDTLKVAQEYAGRDERVKLLTQENAGVSAARNHGMREAKGEYMIFLDSDDWLEDDAVGLLLEAQEQHPDKLVTMREYIVSFVPNRSDVFSRHQKMQHTKIKIFSGIKEIKSMENESVYLLSATTKMFKAEILHKYNLRFNERNHHGEDVEFMFNYCQKVDKLVLLDKALLNILVRPGSASRSRNPDRFSILANSPEPDFNDESDPVMKTEHKARYARWSMNRFVAAVSSNLNVDSNILYKLRAKSKKYTHEFLFSSIVDMRHKLMFMIVSYVPLSIVKFIIPFAYKVRKFLQKQRDELIPYW